MGRLLPAVAGLWQVPPAEWAARLTIVSGVLCFIGGEHPSREWVWGDWAASESAGALGVVGHTAVLGNWLLPVGAFHGFATALGTRSSRARLVQHLGAVLLVVPFVRWVVWLVIAAKARFVVDLRGTSLLFFAAVGSLVSVFLQSRFFVRSIAASAVLFWMGDVLWLLLHLRLATLLSRLRAPSATAMAAEASLDAAALAVSPFFRPVVVPEPLPSVGGANTLDSSPLFAGAPAFPEAAPAAPLPTRTCGMCGSPALPSASMDAQCSSPLCGAAHMRGPQFRRWCAANAVGDRQLETLLASAHRPMATSCPRCSNPFVALEFRRGWVCTCVRCGSTWMTMDMFKRGPR